MLQVKFVDINCACHGPKVTFSHTGHWSLFQKKVFESVLTNEDFPEIQAVSI